MAEKKPVEFEEVADDSAKVVEKAKGFWERYSKMIVYGGGGLIALLAAYIGYNKFYAEPRQTKAQEAIWRAQQYFQQDSLRLALSGDGQFPGFEKVARNYSGTKAGNLARYYAGICHLRLGDFKKAESQLKDFNTGAKEIQAIAWARLADALAEQGKQKEAVAYYAKAGYHFPEQEALSAEFLFRAGLLSEVLGNSKDAVKYYQEIKDKYSRTSQGTQIDKYLARLGEVGN
jgi:TolA-binding protein